MILGGESPASPTPNNSKYYIYTVVKALPKGYIYNLYLSIYLLHSHLDQAQSHSELYLPTGKVSGFN